MTHQTQIQKVLLLAKEKGIIRPRDLDVLGISRPILSRLVNSGQIEKIERGLYRLSSTSLSDESLTSIAVRVPKSVFCLHTALQFHELTTQLPRQVWIALPKGSHKPSLDYPPLTMVQLSPKTFSAGIEKHKINNIPIQVYSVEKTIVDCFRFRNRIGIDVALEAIKDANRQNRLSQDALWHFAEVSRMTSVIRPYLEAIE